MKRVLVLGEFRADRLVPALARSGAQVTVLGFADLTGFLDPRVTCGTLPKELTSESLSALVDEHQADTVVASVSSPGQEQMLTLYARVGRSVGPRRMPVHSEAFATLACDKVALHRQAIRRGWPVPAGVVCERPERLGATARQVGFPLLVKEARSESFAGRFFVSDPSRLAAVGAAVTYPVLVQQAVQGEEFAVELLTLPSGTVAWPVASLGPLDGECAPGRRARVQPALLPEAVRFALSTVVRDIVATSRPVGPWQIDFAVTRGGRLNLIEINGRFGGVSNMSWTSTGTDPHRAHAEATLHGRLPEHTHAVWAALEVPVPNGTTLPPAPAGTVLSAFTANPGYPNTSGVHRAVLGVPPAHAPSARAWLRRLVPGTLLVPVDSAIDRLEHGLAALSAEHAADVSAAVAPRAAPPVRRTDR
ncbi:hypothetical protein [Streptomyces yunnanensis]|uniref:ATP-grasp domain-containing protein n=1 Tax=Streptomyces yunnanensis TaxID=156453 RepID=A0A9X8MPR8_9ACTN|nr:hypothetical protein [Streptomyces yunnanensis]SHL35917.1 hypothetical protein SAMN05216268_10441 [Streptomyces yunnanensis]